MKQALISIMSNYKAENAIELLKEHSISDEIYFKAAASMELISNFEKTVAKMPDSVKNLYMFSNGFCSPNLEILSIFDKHNPKKTWDSIDKAEKTTDKGFAYRHGSVQKFCMFGRLAPPNYAIAYDKDDGSLCLESENAIIKTCLNLRDFLAICLQSDKLSKPVSEYLKNDYKQYP